ncbi:nuclease [Arthrobacter phage EastWest]|uniref:Nuclease n=1 Tax=Arthrobacter phage EastWest TaxID=2894292 RepID=A0AAE8YK69_9CAUD|nr:nuclease [Arthrobacter phage EastWest]
MTLAPQPNYIALATITRWVDGDSLWMKPDLTHRVSGSFEYRLLGVDCSDVKLPRKLSGDFARSILPEGSVVSIRTEKDPEKYGRWLAVIYLDDGTTFNDLLLQRGYAVPYFGGKRAGK